MADARDIELILARVTKEAIKNFTAGMQSGTGSRRTIDASDVERILANAPKEALDATLTVTSSIGETSKSYSGSARTLLVLGLVKEFSAPVYSPKVEAGSRDVPPVDNGGVTRP